MGKASQRDGGGREPAGIRHSGGGKRHRRRPDLRRSNPLLEQKNAPRCGFSYPRVNLERF
jgi:hypothetical protein